MNIDKNSPEPLYMQIYKAVIDEIINGYLIPEDKLPSRRRLCGELGVSPQTVETAYSKLVSDGYIVARAGSGYYVSSERVWDEERKIMKSRVYNFSSNGIETSKLPFADWSRLMRATIREDTGLFQHGEKAGEWCLRKSIRRMLFRTQNIKCRTEQIIIGPGAEDLLRELFNLFDSRRVLMNNYYNYRVYNIAKELRADASYITSGKEGIDIDELWKYKSGFLYQKPTHDLPTGVTLTEAKRRALLEWAGDGRYIIEDARENDFQYTSKRKTLWEMSEGRSVIYLGSFSSTIAPSMKIGYIVAPEEIVKLWFREKRFYANRVSRAEQVTLSKFIDKGFYEKHINYMHSIYREKAAAVKNAALSSPLGERVRISGSDAGTFCVMNFDIDCGEKKANELLISNGIKLSPVSSSLYDKSRVGFEPNTYVVGYGEMTISQIRDGISLWAEIWKNYL